MRLLFALAALCFSIWAADNTIGTWNRQDPGRQGTLIIEPSGKNGVKVKSSGVRTDGSSATLTFTAQYDRRENPVTGSRTWDTIALEQVDANNVTAVLTKMGGKLHYTDRLLVSPDGKTLTFTRNGMDGDGKAVKNQITVFKKQ